MKAFAIKDPCVGIQTYWIRKSPNVVRKEFVASMSYPIHGVMQEWEHFYKKGYRVVKVTITEFKRESS